MQNFRLSTARVKFYKICTLIGYFCWKYIKFQQKKYGGNMSHDTKSAAKFEEKLTCGLENDMRNLANFHQNTWNCQNWYFHGTLLSKVQNTWATNLQRSYNDTEEWWKIWRGIDLSFQNWHKEFDEFWLENSKVSKMYTLVGCFWPKYIMFELKK